VPALEPPELRDGVVTLRAHRDADADAVVAAVADPQILRWLPNIPRDYRPADYHVWTAEVRRSIAEGRALNLLIEDPAGRVVGSIGVNDIDARPHIGYWLAAGARGRGYAARALRLLRDWAHAELALEPVEVLVHPENLPSRRVAQAAGFVPTGEYRRPPTGGIDGADYMVLAWPEDGAAGAGAG
jgi:RimJ/RimL family protein N-acetyltransferase